jgi:hypothetical protein
METGPEGNTHFEVQSATNLRTNATVGTGAHGPAPSLSADVATDDSNDFAAAPGRNENVERRLKALEVRISQLREEIRRLRREP